MPTVKVHAPELSGQTGLLLWLYKDSDGTLLNAGGDTLIESGTTGLFSATVAETIAAIHRADVTNSAGTLVFRSGWIAAAGTVVRDEFGTISGGGGSGSGARTVTVTVDDGSTALQNATVRMTEGVNTYTATTNASGVATFNLDDATYTVGVSKSGYSFAGTTLVVDGTETVTYSMTAVTITPSTGAFTTGYLTTYDIAGQIEAGVNVNIQMTIAPSGTGVAYDSAITTVASDANGLVEFPGMAKGGTYWLWRGTTSSADYETGVEVAIASGAGPTTALTNVAGDP